MRLRSFAAKAAILTLVSLLVLAIAPAQQVTRPSESAYGALKRDAERLRAEKSYSRAKELYEKAAALQLSGDDRAWTEMRIADLTWRADAASPDPDATAREKAIDTLQDLFEREPPDLVVAEAGESLGDYYTTHPYARNVHQSREYYVGALDYWAGTSDLDTARSRYLAIVWKLSPESAVWNVPREVLVNAVAIAVAPPDRARARFLLASHYFNDNRPENVERGMELLDEVIRMGRNDWYDDALYAYATKLTQLRPDSGDGDATGPDYVRALELYRRLTSEFTRGETRWYDSAVHEIREITLSQAAVLVGSTFLPGSEQELALTWRNVAKVELAIYPVDLTRDVDYSAGSNWIEQLRIDGRSPVRKWTYETGDDGRHRPGNARVRIEPRLGVGAWAVKATAAGSTTRQLLLVSDAQILLHKGPKSTDIFVSDVITGEPIPNARVQIWQRPDDRYLVSDAQTNDQGLTEVPSGEKRWPALVTASANGRQAWVTTPYYWYSPGRDADWRVYAFTDRPAYRPRETVQWKAIARVRENEEWKTPQGSELAYEIVGPRGEKVASGTAKLNEYGSFWGELPLTEEMALGSYQISFKQGDSNRGRATLFRLEEYKLPEFSVTVSTPEETRFRLGDTIDATIDANYYFGGPVANATVQVAVRQVPFVRYWYPWREYDWYWPATPSYGPGNILRTETLKTDASGRAVLRIETPRDGSDTTYTIEARVTDASRREVRGQGSVRVTKQRYSVLVQPKHYIHRTGERTELLFKAIDANDRPVTTTGTVSVHQRSWKARWSDFNGQRIDRGRYVDTEVLTTKLTTNEEGEAPFSFTPKRDGYYVIRWRSSDAKDPNREPKASEIVAAETSIWATSRDTRELGYRAGNLDVIVDREAVRTGESADVLLVTPESGRWVLFTTLAGNDQRSEAIRIEGTAKLVRVPVDERMVPNFFVTASSVFDRQLTTETERIVVPPAEKFVTVDVAPDRDAYGPREEGTVKVTTRDASGKPVSAEVAISVSDESVTAIGSDPAGDPRQFFYGDLRVQQTAVDASVRSQRYVRLVADDDGTLIDEELRARRDAMKEERDEGAMSDFAKRGVAGGAPPPPPAPVMQGAVAESITVTAEAPEVPVSRMAMTMPMDAPAAKVAGNAADGGGIDVMVRSDFRSTAFWQPAIVTDAAGVAVVKVRYPEALTTWRATARAVTAGSQFGMGTATSRTSMPLLVRLQAPRFFVAGDRAVVSAVINNNGDEPETVTPALEVDGVRLDGGGTRTPLIVPAHGEARVDWNVVAERNGNATLRVFARGERHGDAMEKKLDVFEHGIDKLIARSGKLRGDEAVVRLDLPRERRATALVVQISPSLAVTMLDAIPYLIDYPYGCTEQTMSRFLPAAIVARTLEKLGLDRADIEGKMFGGISTPARDQKKDIGRLDAVTRQSMARLYDFQHGDGGWGWWEEGDSDTFMTAYVVWGFAVARDGGLSVRKEAVERAVEWLDEELVKYEDDPDRQAWMLHAMSAWRGKAGTFEKRALENVWAKRETLSAYARALLALSAHRYGDAEKASVLVRNLENGVKVDEAPDQSVLLRGERSANTIATAHWGATRFWWRWHEGPVETTAFVLDALVTIDPKHRLIEPAMNWLVKNRRGAQWNNTRDTAIALLALNDYLRASGELAGDVSYDVTVNGSRVASKTIAAADVITAPSRIAIDPAILRDTVQEIVIRRTGGRADAALYFSAEARFVSLEEPVKSAGNEIFVRREYFRLAARPTLLKGVVYDRIPLRDGDAIVSGERVEVVATVETKNDYEYLFFEDLKPAGFEAVELQSGTMLWATETKSNRTAWVYQELRDRKVAMFVDRLPQGLWEIRYTLRAETPGSFHALPLLGEAMYVPEIRANGEEMRVVVEDRR